MEHLDGLEKRDLLDFKNHTYPPVRRKKLSLSKKARRCPTEISVLKRAGCQTVKSFREIDSSKDRPRVRLGFVKPFRNGLRKIKNLIKNILTTTETDLEGRENGVRESASLSVG